jgi:proteasome lid subunit RPN8/RPN11
MIHEHLDATSFRRMRKAAHRQADKGGFEVCGAIVREDDGALHLWPLENLATDPAKWLIEKEWLRKIRRKLKVTNKRLVGTYHSHVGGYAYPSDKDLDYYPSAFLMMIYDTQDRRVGMWKPLIRNDTAKLRPVAVTCDSPKWGEKEAIDYASYLRLKFRAREKRNEPNQSLQTMQFAVTPAASHPSRQQTACLI